MIGCIFVRSVAWVVRTLDEVLLSAGIWLVPGLCHDRSLAPADAARWAAPWDQGRFRSRRPAAGRRVALRPFPERLFCRFTTANQIECRHTPSHGWTR